MGEERVPNWKQLKSPPKTPENWGEGQKEKGGAEPSLAPQVGHLQLCDLYNRPQHRFTHPQSGGDYIFAELLRGLR